MKRRAWRPVLLGILLATAGLSWPLVSSAATICVNKTGAQCSQIFAAGEIKAAFSAANANQVSHDRIEIGPGTYAQGPFNAASNIEIIGAGIDRTVLTHSGTLALNDIVLLANFGSPLIQDLTVRLGAGMANRALQVGGGVVERVKIEATSQSDPSPAMDAFGVTARDLEVTVPMDASAIGGGGLIEDSVIRGGQALFWNSGVARRLRITAVSGARMTGSSRLENSRIQAVGPDSIGVRSEEFFGGSPKFSHLTIVGDRSPGGVGVMAVKSVGGAMFATTSSIEVRNSVISGFPVAVRHRGAAGSEAMNCFPNCQVVQETTFLWSLIDGAIVDQGGPGQLNLGAGVQRNASPSFVNPGAGDFRPRFDSPLIDTGESVRLGEGPFYLGESPLTVAGGPRILAGKAQATTPRRDIGAYEYGRGAPSAAIAEAPKRVFLYRPVRFRAKASDPDGDPLRFAFDFGERGRSAADSSNPVARHTFISLGPKRVRLTVTDPTGLAAVAPTDLRVVARAGRCANRRVGGPRRDRFNGSPVGDDLRGRGGRDILRGAGGADCLSGGAGRDVLNGGRGRDVLIGGPGADRIVGGPGVDRINGGAGNDVINARGGGRDVVNCGTGRRDVVTADRRDRIRNCEIIRRH